MIGPPQAGPARCESRRVVAVRAARDREIGGMDDAVDPRRGVGGDGAGFGAVLSATDVEVPTVDDLAVFTGDIVMDVNRGCDVVRGFVRTGSPGAAEQWHEM